MDFLKTASSFLGSDEKDEKKSESHPPKKQGAHSGASDPKPGDDDIPSYQEVFSSAQVVFGAAKGKFGGGKEETDVHKVADAAEDLIQAAKHYGHLDGGQYGKYLDQAEGYVHSYAQRDGVPPSTEHKDSPEVQIPPPKVHHAPAEDE